MDGLFYGFCPKKQGHLVQNNPHLLPSKSKFFHQKLPLWIGKETPLSKPTKRQKTPKKKIPIVSRKIHRVFFPPSPSVRLGVSNGSVPKRCGAEGTKRQDTAGSAKAWVILSMEWNLVNSPVDMVFYFIFLRVSEITGGAGFLPSKVCEFFFFRRIFPFNTSLKNLKGSSFFLEVKFDEDLGVIWRVIWDDFGFVWVNGMAFIFLPLENNAYERTLGAPFFQGFSLAISAKLWTRLFEDLNEEVSWLPSRHSTVYMTVCLYAKPIYIYMDNIRYR